MVGGVIGIAAIIGVVLAVIRVNLTRTTLDLYKADNDALRGRVDTLEAGEVQYKAKIASMEAEVIGLKEERAHLRDLVTGASKIDELGVVLAGYHSAMLEALTGQSAAITSLAKAMGRRIPAAKPPAKAATTRRAAGRG